MNQKNEALKLCKKCMQTLPMSMFHNYKQSLDGKNPYCKKCVSYMQKKSREKRELEEYLKKKELEKIKEENKQEDIKTKVCFRCKVEKDITNFHRDKRQKDGYNNVCIECKKIREAENILKRLEKRGY